MPQGFGEHSIIEAPLAAVLLPEVLGAAIILAVFLGAASRDTAGRDTVGRDTAPASIPASLAVGLSFAALLQLGQSVGNLPFNPARAAASALFSSEWAEPVAESQTPGFPDQADEAREFFDGKRS